GWLRMRITVVRGFAAYLATLDPAAEVPPASLLPGGTRRAVPYLYSAADITALFAQAERLRTPQRAAAIQTLIGLLAVTGMRIGEALSLDDEDFDTAEGTLLVRHAKFGKHRLLSLHPTAVTAVQGYRRLRDQAFPHPASPALLVSSTGTRRLLVSFAATRTGTPPCRLDIADLDAPMISAFLDHAEHERRNSIRTRNARLAAIHSLFGFMALRHPEHAADLARVLAIPPKRADQTIVTLLTAPEADALLSAPDRATRTGRRAHAWVLLAIQTGLRAS